MTCQVKQYVQNSMFWLLWPLDTQATCKEKKNKTHKYIEMLKLTFYK